MKRITILAAAGVLVATPAIGAWAAFAATDDNPSRDTSNVRVDDRGGRGEPEPGDDHGRHHRHGADGPAGHVRHSGEPEPGDDRNGQVELEPGDDRGGQGELEPGDDRGGQGELEPGDDHGGQGELEPGDDHGYNSGPGGDDDGVHHGGDDGSGHH
jgi:hypothetical protein